MSASLPNLPYGYDALEPYISQEIMELHHKKHHQAYVNGLNAAEASYAQANSPVAKIALQKAIKFNGGGHVNHSLFWKNLTSAPDGSKAKGEGGQLHAGPLKDAIDKHFGGLESLQKIFNAETLGIQGSGWGWLVYNTQTKSLQVDTTPNQDPILAPLVPIIGVDIWEHAFYLQYKNVKPDYLAAIWHVIDFKEAEKRFVEASQGSKL